jgi:hypothetical protein
MSPARNYSPCCPLNFLLCVFLRIINLCLVPSSFNTYIFSRASSKPGSAAGQSVALPLSHRSSSIELPLLLRILYHVDWGMDLNTDMNTDIDTDGNDRNMVQTPAWTCMSEFCVPMLFHLNTGGVTSYFVLFLVNLRFFVLFLVDLRSFVLFSEDLSVRNRGLY